jgi:DNA-binding CsgD family transcriptional regulator
MISVESESFVDEHDVRGMVRLLGEVAANPGNHSAKKRQLMEGLCQLVSADYWVWSVNSSRGQGEQPDYLHALNGGFEPDQFGRLAKVIDHPEMKAFTAPFVAELAEKRAHLTRRLHQIYPEEAWPTEAVVNLWKEAGIGAIMLSFRPLDEKQLSAIALYRRLGQPLFDAREARIAHIVLTEVPRLHAEGWPQDRNVTIPGLAPRPCTVLNLLLQGLSRKEIATSIGVTEGTVNDYVKVVYKRFRVQSQSQLMNRLLRGAA